MVNSIETPPENYTEDLTVNTTNNETPNNTESNSSLNLTDVSKDSNINEDIFKNRREMAWLSLKGIIAFTITLFVFLCVMLILFLAYPDKMSSITINFKTYLDWSSSFITGSYTTLAAVILAYMGVSAWYYGRKK